MLNLASRIMLRVAKCYEEQLDKVSQSADKAKESVEKLDAVMDEHKRKQIPNGGSGYRSKECPTGEEMNYILKFWFSFISDNFNEYNRILETKVRKIEKLTAALAATNAAVVLILIKAIFFSDNQ